jgi:chemotaxis-related protein WspB
MLVLTFRVAETDYAVAASRVVEVVPRVPLREVPHTPAHVAGLLRYRGRAIPVVDLSMLLTGTPSVDRLDTRIILADASLGGRDGGVRHLLGLVAERVGEVRGVDASNELEAKLDWGRAAYLGAVLIAEGGLVQLVEPGAILADVPSEAGP